MDKGSIKEERIYFGNFELYRKFDGSSSLKVERQTVHVSDDTGRIAMLEKRTYGTAADNNNTAATLTRYIYSNHLQSATLELDENAAIISYEEYHPYGTTSYQAMNASIKAVAKRYRYTGKERDEESGLYYHGARYYAPWLCRWLACDPINSENYNIGKGYGLQKNKERDFLELCASSYEYCYDNPVRFNDPIGEQAPRNKQTTYNPHLPSSISSDIEGVYALPQLKKYNLPTKKSDVDLEASSDVNSEKNNKGKKATKKSSTIRDSVNKMMSDPETKLALENASQKTSISLSDLMVMAIIESGGNKNIGTNKSSYTGLMQMGQLATTDVQKIDSTITFEKVKSSVEINALAGAIYMKKNFEMLTKNNIETNVLNLYLSHQQGLSGFTGLLKDLKTNPNSLANKNQLNNIAYGYTKHNGKIVKWGSKESKLVTKQEFYQGWVAKIDKIKINVDSYLNKNINK